MSSPATSQVRQSPPLQVPPLPPPRKDVFQHISDFWRRVTEGMKLQQLWNQFQTEARTGYQLYSRDVEAQFTKTNEVKPNWIQTAGHFFWAVLMKLSPPKRVVLLIGLVMMIFGNLSFRADNEVVTLQTQQLGGVLILLLLVLETADRVTMKRDLEIARDIQQWLVPSEAPAVPGLDIAFVTRPANTVAGDYYDVIRRGDTGKYLIVIADVAGKSMPAALLMATFQASLKTLSAASASLPELATGLNRYACDHSIRGTRFTTAILAEYDPADCSITYINAGHNPPLLIRGQEIQQLSTGGVPLGILTDAQYEYARIRLRPDDVLAIFTDGVVEASNVAGQEFGEDRLIQVIRMVPGGTSAELIRHIMANVESFVATAPQHDDITCMMVRCVPQQ
jgi:phosphoserine phosphatase RsbU/P